MARCVQLTQGKCAIVDDADYLRVRRFKWFAHKSETGIWYAVRSLKADGVRMDIGMHRLLLGAGSEQEVDHRDGDGLNNRRENIRLCTKRQNARNRKQRPWPTKSSVFQGVCWSTRVRRWRAYICAGPLNALGHSKQIYIGQFLTEEDAAAAYDVYALRLFGSFAKTNFPMSRYAGQCLTVARPPPRPRFGEHNPRAKLTDHKVRRIRVLAKAGLSISSLGRRFEVDKSLIARVVKRQSWSHV